MLDGRADGRVLKIVVFLKPSPVGFLVLGFIGFFYGFLKYKWQKLKVLTVCLLLIVFIAYVQEQCYGPKWPFMH